MAAGSARKRRRECPVQADCGSMLLTVFRTSCMMLDTMSMAVPNRDSPTFDGSWKELALKRSPRIDSMSCSAFRAVFSASIKGPWKTLASPACFFWDMRELQRIRASCGILALGRPGPAAPLCTAGRSGCSSASENGTLQVCTCCKARSKCQSLYIILNLSVGPAGKVTVDGKASAVR